MVRVLADDVTLGQGTRQMSGLPHIGKALAREPKESGGTANRKRLHAVRLPRHAVIVIAYAEFQRQIRADFPIVFEEGAPFVLMVVLDPRRGREYRFGRRIDV